MKTLGLLVFPVLLVAACGPRDVIPDAPLHPANPSATAPSPAAAPPVDAGAPDADPHEGHHEGHH